MSASLVGSEMCIRDSNATGHASTPYPLLHQGARLSFDARLSLSFRLRLPCLLYTSDAADDM
eukprot:11148431-Alexandrium_andersonii.AAC.1